MNAAEQRKLTPILAALTMVLGAGVLLLVAGVGRGAHWDAPAPLPPLPAVTNAGKPLSAKPPQQFAIIWQKPLFNPDRQPLVRATNGRSSVGDFTLTGVILTPTLRMALLHDRNGNKELSVREGSASEDGSVTLVQVRPRSAIFDSSAGRVELELPSGAPIDPRAPNTTPASVNQGQPTDSRAMAATAPPDGEANPEDRASDSRIQSTPPASAIHEASPVARPPVEARPPPAGRSSSASGAERIRKATLQRQAARAASSPEGVH